MGENRASGGPEIDQATCTACGLCERVCPVKIPLKREGGMEVSPSRRSLCIGCAQCMAVCPSESIMVGGLSYETDLTHLPAEPRPAEAFYDLLRMRRSVREFEDTPVPRELLEKVVEAASLAPMSFPPHRVEVTVVATRSRIEAALPEIAKFCEGWLRGLNSGIGRFIMRRVMPLDTYTGSMSHLKPLMEAMPGMEEDTGVEAYTWGAPAMLLFHAPKDAPFHSDDAPIAMTCAMLGAAALGLGTTIIGTIPAAVNHARPLRELLAIPDGHVACGCVILGYPKVRYKRAIRRELANVRYLE